MPGSQVDVLDVGDGACTVLRPWPEMGHGPTAVIDCGAWRASQTVPAQALHDCLQNTLADVTAVAITHFDFDHWKGFTALPRLRNIKPDLGQIDLYYPAMPRVLPAALMAMMGPITGTGSAALDVQKALGCLHPQGNLPHLHPLTKASCPIKLAGETLEVLWPPRELSDTQFKGICAAVQQVNELADDMASSGHHQLRTALDIANAETPDVPKDPLDQHDGDRESEESRRDDGGAAHDDAVPAPDIPEDFVPPDIPKDFVPPEFRARYRETLTQIRRMNNDLSLVLASLGGDRSRRFVTFGDISGHALQTVLGSFQAGIRYEVMLMPHHGTHALARGMPPAKYCVSQTGQHHHQNLQPHPEADHQLCLSLHEYGNFPPHR